MGTLKVLNRKVKTPKNEIFLLFYYCTYCGLLSTRKKKHVYFKTTEMLKIYISLRRINNCIVLYMCYEKSQNMSLKQSGLFPSDLYIFFSSKITKIAF